MMTKPDELTAERVAAMICQGGVTVDEAYAIRNVHPWRVADPDKPPHRTRNPRYWTRADVLRWMKRHNLDPNAPKRLVKLEALARIKGLGYWEARRSHEPAVVLGYSNKWYDLDA